MLPHVVRRNAPAVNGAYAALWKTGESSTNGRASVSGAEAVAEFLAESAAEAGLASRLRDQRIERDRLPQLAVEATKQWTGTFNPVALTETDFLALYEAAY
jgi:alcohol dehydrogenase